MEPKVLVVEDDPTLLDTLEYNLLRQQYEVLTAKDGVSGLELARQEQPDLILLDLMLPGLDGLEVCRILRQEMTVPILMLTARGDEIDKVVGLEVGADDYITKPFNPREVAVRVRAVLRRTGKDADEGPVVMRRANLVIDRRCHEVRVRGDAVDLTPTEFKLLGVLAEEPGRAFTRSELLDRVFGYDFDGFERTVDAHVKNLRKKIEPNPKKPAYVSR